MLFDHLSDGAAEPATKELKSTPKHAEAAASTSQDSAVLPSAAEAGLQPVVASRILIACYCVVREGAN